MSTVSHLVRQIRALPYADMMMVANEIRDRLGDLTQQRIEANTLAEILSRLNEGAIPISDATKEEEKVLKQIFRVKRAMSIQQHGSGWAIEVNSVPGSSVVHSDLRSSFGMMLDQVITIHCLTRK